MSNYKTVFFTLGILQIILGISMMIPIIAQFIYSEVDSSFIGGSIISIISEGDFYSLSSCRDLLFHVQEHRFTLPKIEQALDDLNLKFLGFQLSEPWIRRSFKNFYPDEDSLTSLSLWNQFELKNPNTFRGMYQFWVQKS